jgi:hypothetical protein
MHDAAREDRSAKYVERPALDMVRGERMKKSRKGESEHCLGLEMGSALTHGAHANAYKKPCSHRNKVLRARTTVCLHVTYTRLTLRHMKIRARPMARTLKILEESSFRDK